MRPDELEPGLSQPPVGGSEIPRNCYLLSIHQVCLQSIIADRDEVNDLRKREVEVFAMIPVRPLVSRHLDHEGFISRDELPQLPLKLAVRLQDPLDARDETRFEVIEILRHVRVRRDSILDPAIKTLHHQVSSSIDPTSKDALEVEKVLLRCSEPVPIVLELSIEVGQGAIREVSPPVTKDEHQQEISVLAPRGDEAELLEVQERHRTLAITDLFHRELLNLRPDLVEPSQHLIQERGLLIRAASTRPPVSRRCFRSSSRRSRIRLLRFP